ncbi:hypothetical protein [Microbulbifer sp. THAF38]|uniref:hypothetical protein n=1 Tax=Microbulbifer sp. THAF38 TaxID=2587856 RepID=UPI0012693352|nr:hypothetical protein [Microbulbifer sp. THAF38]QFT57079.1 hypothetical protein FIU95_21240 [Microbulbifer sp. THAF38]
MKSKNKKTIYCLEYASLPVGSSDMGDIEFCRFYIGHTSRPTVQREGEHRRAAANGDHRDVYVYIRELENRGITWNLETLHEVAPDDDRPWELWAVIEAIREGHDLRNMRQGDSAGFSLDEREVLASDQGIQSVDDIEPGIMRLQKRMKSQNPIHPKRQDDANFTASLKTQVVAILSQLKFLRYVTESVQGEEKVWEVYTLTSEAKEIFAERGMDRAVIAKCIAPIIQKRLNSFEVTKAS